MKIEPLLQICWLIANEEAKHLGATEIQPLHFLLGILKVIDPAFPTQLERTEIPPDVWAEMCTRATSIRHYLEIIPERVTDKRRKLRAKLEINQKSPSIKQPGMLHRSQILKQAFVEAASRSENEEVLLRQLVQVLFELDIISLDDIEG